MHGASQTARVAGAATSAAHPARNAGQISLRLSSDQPGSALHATCAYFAGSEGCAGVAGATGAVPGGRGVSRGRVVVAQPATVSSTASSNAAVQGTCAARWRSKGSEERDKMLWFFLEALVALLIAVAIVMWTMGSRRRKPPPAADDAADRDELR